MKKHSLIYCLTTMLCVVGLTATAGSPTQLTKPDKVGMSSERIERLSEAMKGYVDRGELSGNITLVAR